MAFTDYFTGDITLDENTRTELIDAFPALKNDVELNKFEKLPKEYVNQKIIPELLKLKDHQQIQKLKVALEANSKLKALVSQFAFAPLPAGTMPSREDTMDNIKDSVDSTFQDFVASSKKLLGIESAEERKEYLTQQIVFRANRARAAMDKTLLGASDGMTHLGGKSWDGKYYGPHGGPINKWFAGNDIAELDQTASDGSLPEVQEEVGNYDKDAIEQMLASVVSQSQGNSLSLTIMEGMTETYENKEQQMKAALEWLYAVEAGWEQNRDYISFSAKWVKDNAVELGLGTLGSLGIGAIMILLAAAWGVKKFGGALSHVPGMGIIKKLGPVLAKIPKYGPIIGAVGAIIPSAKPDPLMDFKPDTEPKHKALQDMILDEMWKTDKATQDKVINDIWTRESATLTGAGVTEADFKAEIRNTASGISTRYPALRTEFETKVGAVQGSSLAPDFKTYKDSVLKGTDLGNQGEYEFRVEKALKAQEKGEKSKTRGGQQQAQVEEGRAVAGDIKHPKNRIRTAASRIPGVNPPPILKLDPTSHLTQSEAITRAQALRDRAKLLEVTEIELSDKTKIKMTKLDGKTLTALEGFEAEIASAEAKEQEIIDKIRKAKDRLLKELDFHLLPDVDATKTGTIANQEAKVNTLVGNIAVQQSIIDGIEGEARFRGKSSFELGKLSIDPTAKSRYNDAVREKTKLEAVLGDATKPNTESGKLQEMRERLKTITKERASAVRLQTEATIRAYLGVDNTGAPKSPADGLYKDLETQASRINSAKGAMVTHYTELAKRYSERMAFDAAKMQLTIDGVLTDIKKGAAKIRGIVPKG